MYERQLRDVGDSKRVYHPRRDALGAGIFMLVTVGAMLVFILQMPVKPGEQWAFAGVLAFIGSMFLLFLWATLHCWTQTLTITEQGITDKSVFRTLHIPFSRVQSLSARTVQGRHSTFELTKIEGEGQKITLMSKMKDYGLLLDFIRQRVGETAKVEGEVKAQAATAKQLKQANVFGGILLGIILLIFGGMGAQQLREGRTDQKNYRLLDTQGRTTTGRVTGTELNGPRAYRYRIRFAFEEPDGIHHEGVDPVSYYDYQAARVGSPIQVTYIPGRGGVACIGQSIRRGSITGNIRGGEMFLGAACSISVLFAIGLIFAKKPTDAASQ